MALTKLKINYINSLIPKYINGVDVIYWINLDRSTGRRNNMENILKDPVFNFVPKIIRFSAIDGSNKNFFYEMTIINEQTRLKDTEYACLLSHLKVIHTFVKNYKENAIALILEDDATLEYKKYWTTDLINIIKNAPSDWEIIQLEYIQFYMPQNLYVKNNPNKNPNEGKSYYGTLAYVINYKSAVKLINKIYNNNKYIINTTFRRNTADILIYEYLTTYVYKYPYFTYKLDTMSDINYSIVNCHNECRLFIDNIYRNIYYANNLIICLILLLLIIYLKITVY